MSCPSQIFTGFRALGFVSNHIPLAVRHHQKHKENYVVTCVGKAFHTYNCSRLGIVSVSNLHPDQITCLAVDAYLVFTACNNVIYAYTRGREVAHTFTGHEKSVHCLLPFGRHLISVDELSCVCVWDIATEECYLEMQFDNSCFRVSAAIHPSTYLNKVLFASQQGALQLWNVHTNKLLYTFPGWGSAVTALEQAPAVDVVAVGLSSGCVVVHNIRYDEKLMSFTQDWGPVTAISFRTDGHPVMVTGSPAGHIALWNLEEKKLQSQMRDAHCSSVTGLQCLQSEPLLVTSSPDNSVKVWIFDQPDGGGRLLRQRTGHSAPPTKVCYHGNTGQTLLTAAQDSTLRSFSTVHDRLDRSLGRASYNKKATKRLGLKNDTYMMPPIIDFASEPSRQSDWDSVIACHRGKLMVTTWHLQRSTMGSHHLKPTEKQERRQTRAVCVAITSCGNFGLVGYSSGHVDIYNMQSGLHRGSYGTPTAHKGAVRGVATDGLNQVTITAGADTCVKFWKFKTKELMETLTLDCQISRMTLHRDSSMLAVALDDFSVTVVDIDTRRTVRIFAGHTNTVTDMTFRSDARWLITSSMDSTVRTWDLPSGRLIDCFLIDSAVTSLTLSPTGDFLATTHVDDLGVYLWSNMTLYTHVALRPLAADFEPQVMDVPSTSRRSQGVIEEQEDDREKEQYVESDFKSPEQISNELVTLSLLPNSRWQNLLSLDVIKERNKPKQPPKVPKAAPFFLPTVPGLELMFAKSTDDDKEEKTTSDVTIDRLLPLSAFAQLLHNSKDEIDYGTAMEKLKQLGPSAIDAELRQLGPDAGGSVELLVDFLHMLSYQLQTNRDFELTQAYLGLFLKLHGDTVATEPTLVEAAGQLQEAQSATWQRLEESFNQSLCLVNYFKSAVL
ncbi:hypothetical protein NP493_883g01001 [Ridgeia piscesae]|uniref:Small-subunit processome Utp21 domain-containing protein n=1 Tax=Ridgeia piscesae TaxID=27915 RepID=A0AAD9KMC6_RIDPI|nr:hypothetical protein NP493_883g01001 [Ridgeia piscesae]